MSDTVPQRAAPSPLAAPSLIAVIFINMLGFGIIVPLLPFYAKSFDAPAWQIALIFSAYSVGAFFGEPFWGRLSDKYGRKPLLISTITGNCLCYLALAFAPNIWVAFAIRLVGGLAAGNGAVVQGYIADVTPPEKRARLLSYQGAAWNVGLIFGPMVGGLFAHPDAGPVGFRIPLFMASGLAALCVVAIAVFIKESRVREQAITHRPSRWAAISDAVGHPVIGRLMLLTFLVGFAFTGAAAALTQTFLTGRLSEKYGAGKMLAIGMGLTVVAAAGQTLSPGGGVTIALMCLTAIGQSVAWPNVSAMISQTADPYRQGQILGLNNATGALARVVGPFCAGLIFPVLLDGPFIMGALVVAPAIFLALAASRRAAAQLAAEKQTASTS